MLLSESPTIQLFFQLVIIFSGIMFVFSILIIPVFIARLPSTYFIESLGNQKKLSLPLKALRFALGTLLILAGIIMLFTPGQGIISILIGLMLLPILSTKKVVRRLLTNNKMIQNTLNIIRRKRNKAPFEFNSN
jgi:hypothetical protein